MDTVHYVVDRPHRWDKAFDPDLSAEDLDRLMQTPPFSEMNPDAFPRRIPLRQILKNDCRIIRCKTGELVVREGDYGTSAFMVLRGQVKVVVSPNLPASMLGRRQAEKKGLWQSIAQIWTNPKDPEVRTTAQLALDNRIEAHASGGKQTRIFLQDVPGILDEHRTASLRAGDIFGEIAALSRMPRTSTVFADTSGTELLEIRWQGLRDLMRFDNKLREHVEKMYRERTLATHLREMTMFRHLDDGQLQQVIQQTQFATHGEYEWSGDYKRMAQAGTLSPEKEPVVAMEGDYPNGIILIRAGFARLSHKFGKGERTLNYLGAGREYGFREIVHNWRNKDKPVPLQHTLRVIGYAHLLIIPTVVMEKVVLPSLPPEQFPESFKAEELSNWEERTLETSPTDAGARLGAELMEFLTENRYFNGTATMVIEMDRCTRCDDCVRACAVTHENNPRFLRHGPVSGKVMIANACMHCADPVCMIGCPTGAIHRADIGGEVVINQATCIGCNACANNCPYEAIRMVEIRDEEGAFMVDQELRPILKATKCDLCAEQLTGPACERACPHGALKRVNMNDLDFFAQWLKR
jgi:Fe-S-cluster-containing dehydrogenase component/CRP-like cAMP-binding protein